MIITTKISLIQQLIKSNKIFSISISENMKVPSTPCLIPKMHKCPISIRFMISSNRYVIKPLSKNIPAAFKLLYKSVERFRNKSKFCSSFVNHSGRFKIASK